LFAPSLLAAVVAVLVPVALLQQQQHLLLVLQVAPSYPSSLTAMDADSLLSLQRMRERRGGVLMDSKLDS
jgi:hypothetical protein